MSNACNKEMVQDLNKECAERFVEVDQRGLRQHSRDLQLIQSTH